MCIYTKHIEYGKEQAPFYIDLIAYEAMQMFEANSNIELDIKRLIYKWKLHTEASKYLETTNLNIHQLNTGLMFRVY